MQCKWSDTTLEHVKPCMLLTIAHTVCAVTGMFCSSSALASSKQYIRRVHACTTIENALIAANA